MSITCCSGRERVEKIILDSYSKGIVEGKSNLYRINIHNK